MLRIPSVNVHISPPDRQCRSIAIFVGIRRRNLPTELCRNILQHTFCSHLSMRGAPARAIQELAGHADLTMAQRYMHLSPAALDAAISYWTSRGASAVWTSPSVRSSAK